MMIGKGVADRIQPQRPQAPEKPLGIADARDGMNALAPKNLSPDGSRRVDEARI